MPRTERAKDVLEPREYLKMLRANVRDLHESEILGKNSEGLLSSYTDFFLDVVKSTPRVKASTLKCAVMLCFDKVTAETAKNFANKVSQAHQYVVAKSKSFVNGAHLSTSTRAVVQECLRHKSQWEDQQPQTPTVKPRFLPKKRKTPVNAESSSRNKGGKKTPVKAESSSRKKGIKKTPLKAESSSCKKGSKKTSVKAKSSAVQKDPAKGQASTAKIESPTPQAQADTALQMVESDPTTPPQRRKLVFYSPPPLPVRRRSTPCLLCPSLWKA